VEELPEELGEGLDGGWFRLWIPDRLSSSVFFDNDSENLDVRAEVRVLEDGGDESAEALVTVERDRTEGVLVVEMEEGAIEGERGTLTADELKDTAEEFKRELREVVDLLRLFQRELGEREGVGLGELMRGRKRVSRTRRAVGAALDGPQCRSPSL
jgi:hypothetical protein